MALVRKTWRHRIGILGVTMLVLVTLTGALAPWISPHDPARQNWRNRLSPPGWVEGGSPEHVLGTDELGRDILSRLIWGARISMLIGFLSVVVSGTLGTAIGLVSGYFGGRLDNFIMRLVDIQMSVPFLVLALLLVAVLGQGINNVILILGIAGWILYARLVRAEVLGLREREYVEAARAHGAHPLWIIYKHVLPNVSATIIVAASFTLAHMIVVEASLSFFGLGVPVTAVTWGRMLAEGREYIQTAWWLSVMPGLAITLTVVSANLLGDWFRDHLDPTYRHR
jgi:peptide/nickel transport system permease protein